MADWAYLAAAVLLDYVWVAPVENWRALVGPELSAQVDAIDELEWAATGRSSTCGQ